MTTSDGAKKSAKTRWETPGFREKLSEIEKETWSDPELRQQHSENLKEFYQTEKGQEARRKRSETLSSEEGSEKLSKAQQERWSDPEARKAQSRKLTGRKRSPESVQKGLETRRRNGTLARSQEAREKIGDKNRGLVRTEEHCEKMRQIHAQPETKRKNREGQYEWMQNIGSHRKDYHVASLDKCVRSSWEYVICNLLDRLGIEYKYEPENFPLSEGDFYLPDFYIPSLDEYWEVKGPIGLASLHKAEKFQREYPDRRLVILSEPVFSSLGYLSKSKQTMLKHDPDIDAPSLIHLAHSLAQTPAELRALWDHEIPDE